MAQSGPSRVGRSRTGPRIAAIAAAIACLMLLAGVATVALIAGLAPGGCACTSTPSPYAGGPTPTPLPISDSHAAAATRPFTGVTMTASYWGAAAGEPIYELTGGNKYAFVDAETGRVLEVFDVDQLPAADAITITAASAQAAATAYLREAGVGTVGLTASVALQHRASTAFYDVTWPEAADYVTPEVLVNATTGSVFAYDDLGFAPKVKLAPPVLSSAAALALAQASIYAVGQATGSPPDFQVVPGTSGEPLLSWWVGFNDGVLSVDAATGQVAIVKWASSR
ncbi:MAG: hypothetical protein ABSE58_02400 [Candidatus Limnocylindrales bacterium]